MLTTFRYVLKVMYCFGLCFQADCEILADYSALQFAQKTLQCTHSCKGAEVLRCITKLAVDYCELNPRLTQNTIGNKSKIETKYNLKKYIISF